MYSIIFILSDICIVISVILSDVCIFIIVILSDVYIYIIAIQSDEGISFIVILRDLCFIVLSSYACACVRTCASVHVCEVYNVQNYK